MENKSNIKEERELVNHIEHLVRQFRMETGLEAIVELTIKRRAEDFTAKDDPNSYDGPGGRIPKGGPQIHVKEERACGEKPLDFKITGGFNTGGN